MDKQEDLAKPGEQLICVDDRRVKHALTEAEDYTVVWAYEDYPYVSGRPSVRGPAYVVICDDGVERVYGANRFIVRDETKQAEYRAVHASINRAAMATFADMDTQIAEAQGQGLREITLQSVTPSDAAYLRSIGCRISRVKADGSSIISWKRNSQ